MNKDFPLLADAKTIILKCLEELGLKASGTSTKAVLESYFNLKHKCIMQQPREVLMSAGLLGKAESLNVAHILEDIEEKFKTGGDINPYLSKGIFRLSDHDHLLNDWRIHHLHLSEGKEKHSDYFLKRSNLLLFVHVVGDKAYLIDIRPHKEDYVFAQRDLLRCIRDNWPELNKKFLVYDEKMEVYPKFDEKDIAIMRRKGYMFFTQVDEHAYAPGLGSAVSGFSLEAGREMDEFHRELYMIHSYIGQHEAELKTFLTEKVSRDIAGLDFRLVYKDWRFYVYERHSRQFVDFDLEGFQPVYSDRA